MKRREIRRLNHAHPNTPVETIRIALCDAIQDALSSVDTHIHFIKCDPGIGKTEILLRSRLQRCCVAFPTHRLKAEAYQRYLKNASEKGFLWPQRPKLPIHLERVVQHKNDIRSGGIRKVYLEALQEEVVRNDSVWVTEIEDYLKSIQDIHRQNLIFTTHEKAWQIQNANIDTYIFDEDCFRSFFKITPVSVSDLMAVRREALKDGGKGKENIVQPIGRILNACEGETIELSQKPYSQTALHGLIQQVPVTSPVEAVFTGKAYYKEKGFVQVLEMGAFLPEKKYVVLSATANENVYRRLLGDRLRFVDLSGTQKKGSVMLHPKRSYSKSTLKPMDEDFRQSIVHDVRVYTFDGIITHKNQVFEKGGRLFIKGGEDLPPVLATFGALEGLDGYSGKSLAVYGTPHLPPFAYALYGHALGLELPLTFEERTVIRNGFEFNFQTCSGDKDFQELQLWLIESELVQAVGRARLVNHGDRIVHLFSNFPIPGVLLEKECPGRDSPNPRQN